MDVNDKSFKQIVNFQEQFTFKSLHVDVDFLFNIIHFIKIGVVLEGALEKLINKIYLL